MTTSRYHLDERPTDPNNPDAIMLELVGSGRSVLHLGCADEHMTRWLAAAGCEVTEAELDSEGAGADLDHLDLGELFEGRTFEVVLCGDVAAQLRDPTRMLVAARRLLAPGGVVVVSVPNVAHGDVRLELLAGRFDYRRDGLLGAANLRMFTRRSLESMLEDAGLVGVDWRRTHCPLGSSELAPPLEAAPPGVRELLEADPDALTYRFIVKAVAGDGSRELGELSNKLAGEQLRADRAELENDALRARSDTVTREAEAIRTQLVEVGSGLSLGQAIKAWRGLGPVKRWVQGRRGTP
ncbi:MAG: methyltransferase domain-containing protein [Candidatus Microthrix parvicella]